MSIEEINRESIRRCTEEVFNKGDLSVIPEVIHSDFVAFGSDGPMYRGLEAFKQMAESGLKAFPDMHYKIEDMFAEGDKIAVRYTYTGTFRGEWMGIPPTGKKYNITTAYLCKMKDGKQLEVWGYTDLITFFRQLGIPLSKPVKTKRRQYHVNRKKQSYDIEVLGGN